jgi:hypothetical protein
MEILEIKKLEDINHNLVSKYHQKINNEHLIKSTYFL